MLDTHVFLWSIDDPSKIAAEPLELIRREVVPVWVSVASIWEVSIKQKSGKLRLRLPLRQLLSEQEVRNKIRVLNIVAPHVLAIESLPPVHKDPFDRLIVAQAMHEDMTLVTADQLLHKYPVKILW